jgi:hypothetical protein
MIKYIFLSLAFLSLTLLAFPTGPGTAPTTHSYPVDMVVLHEANTNGDLQLQQNNETQKLTGDCTIKVKTDDFSGTITFHDVGFLNCVWMKLIALIK